MKRCKKCGRLIPDTDWHNENLMCRKCFNKKEIKKKDSAEKEVFIKKARQKPVGHISKKYRKNIVDNAVVYLPENLIGKTCLVYPISDRQKSLFRMNTYGYKKAKRFIETLIERPRDILKEFEKE